MITKHISSPCRNCQDRELGCHDRCNHFYLFKRQSAALAERIRAEQSSLNYETERKIRIADINRRGLRLE